MFKMLKYNYDNDKAYISILLEIIKNRQFESTNTSGTLRYQI